MDKPSLKALRELHEKATPGPWEQSIAGIEGDNYVAGTGPWHRNHFNESASMDDAALIAAARNALPALLAIAEAARAARPYIGVCKSPGCAVPGCVQLNALSAALAPVED